MQVKNRWLIAAALSLTFSLPFVSAQESTQVPLRYDELPNFYRINEGFYRGGQPKSGGFRRLAQLGVKTVVNLRTEDEKARAEGEEVRAEGLRYYNVGLGLTGWPPPDKVERVLKIIDTPEYQPVFIHCKRGADRVGLIVAIYRMRHGWTAQQAQDEAGRYGMTRWLLVKKDYIRYN